MTNALKDETSPYLLQHAENPVDWHPWNDAALAEARAAGKPILLSIGYSACHWCHVMAHESFEDPETAALMNRLYVNIKVDREERPDLDRIYQLSQQLFTGRPGGWPLTMFLTPDDHVPIFAGTYFPREAAYGMPSFRDVLTRVESYFRTQRAEIARNGTLLVDALARLHWGLDAGADHVAAGGIDAGTRADAAGGTAAAAGTEPASGVDAAGSTDARFSRAPLVEARRLLGESFDARYGGFGGAPKFPHATNVDLLLAAWHRSRREGSVDAGAATMIERTLTHMAAGGLYDHLGGGFFRYCVDAHWGIPHFEKMLYDNAALLATYADAFAATGNALYRSVASATADWVLRDMHDARGGFYSTLDADSEGHEGRFYLFTPEDFDLLLTPAEASAAKTRFGLDGPPNFEGTHWHLQVAAGAAEPPAEAADLVARARAKLLAARRERVWPGRDEKCLVAWNGLMIAALARAARRLGRPELAVAAASAVDFVRAECWQDGRLLAAWKDGRARFPAYLDDYAFLAAGLVELMQARFRVEDLAFARALLDALLDHFADPAGGFFFTADDHETLIHRPKPSADEALPSGNGLAALALDALGHLLGEPRYLDAARRTLAAALPAVVAHPQAHATLLAGLERMLAPPEIVIVRADAAALAEWRAAVDADYAPERLTFLIPDDAGELPGLLASRANASGGVRAYVCSGTECRAPLTSFAAVAEALGLERRV